MLMKSDSNEAEKENVDSGDGADGSETPATHLNERGENFQDQIGMPDEENMRSWSHHHSTDTVDDPVFRAAMRGYDAVSFVFGLEVTWSLIQQRQQEEEEQQVKSCLFFEFNVCSVSLTLSFAFVGNGGIRSSGRFRRN